MGAQDRTEKILRSLHVMLSKSEVYPSQPTKVIVDKDLQIVGAEIYAADAENVANMFAFIINKKITLEELDYMIYAFPSSSSVCLYKLHNIHYDL